MSKKKSYIIRDLDSNRYLTDSICLSWDARMETHGSSWESRSPSTRFTHVDLSLFEPNAIYESKGEAEYDIFAIKTQFDYPIILVAEEVRQFHVVL